MGISAFPEDVRTAIRLRHFSLRTEEVYLHRIRALIHCRGKRHPAALGAEQVRDCLSSLARERGIAASNQNVIRSALVFLYRNVFDVTLEPLAGIAPARRPERLPAVLTREDVKALLVRLDGTPYLMTGLLYGSGLRLMECLRLFTPLLSEANRGASRTLTTDNSPSAPARETRTAALCSRAPWPCRSGANWNGSAFSTLRTPVTASPVSACPTPWPAIT